MRPGLFELARADKAERQYALATALCGTRPDADRSARERLEQVLDADTLTAVDAAVLAAVTSKAS